MDSIQDRFSETLLNAFANFGDAQEYRYFWAIEEGFKRTHMYDPYTSSIPTARKKHECERKCTINPGEKYFRLGDQYSPFKICATCMAMMLYFQKAHLLPAHQHDYWDKEKQRPHWAENSKHSIMMRNVTENLFSKTEE